MPHRPSIRNTRNGEDTNSNVRFSDSWAATSQRTGVFYTRRRPTPEEREVHPHPTAEEHEVFCDTFISARSTHSNNSLHTFEINYPAGKVADTPSRLSRDWKKGEILCQDGMLVGRVNQVDKLDPINPVTRDSSIERNEERYAVRRERSDVGWWMNANRLKTGERYEEIARKAKELLDIQI